MVAFRQFAFTAMDKFSNGISLGAPVRGNKRGLALPSVRPPAQAQAIRPGRGLPEFTSAGNGPRRVEAYLRKERTSLQVRGPHDGHSVQHTFKQARKTGRGGSLVPYDSPGISRGKMRWASSWSMALVSREARKPNARSNA